MILAPEDCGCPLQDSGLSVANVCGGYLFMVLLESYIKGRCRISTPCERVDSVPNVDPEYDFIVIGGGSGGSLVAGRLSEEDKYNVLLLEAGVNPPTMSLVPSFFPLFMGYEDTDWNYRTVPADNYCLDQDGNGCRYLRGKTLGGSNAINGLMYHRGHPADYDSWVAEGATGWDWDSNLKYFFMSEGNKQIGSVVSSQYHSSSGPVPVQQFPYQPPFIAELLKAVNESGLPVIDDLNDPNTPDGFAVAQTMNDNGQRYTTARVYLKPKSVRPNLSVKLNAHVTKIIIENKKAVGVEFIDENGNTQTVKASKEVILSAGALNSPQILMLSGIGPAAELAKHNIPLVEDLPVGENFRNHLGFTFFYNLTEIDNIRQMDWSVLTEYLLKQEGPMSGDAISQLTGLLYSSLADKSRKQPDLQFYFGGFDATCSQTGVIGERDGVDKGRTVTVTGISLLPRSVGTVTLNSSDPLDPPLIDPNYFSHPDDMVMVKDAARYARQIFSSKTFEKYGPVLTSESYCSSLEQWSDEWLECMIRLRTDAQNHQVGTTAIGRVLDLDLKVKNISGLRVIDAGAIPIQPTGGPQAVVMMIAERGVELIKQLWQ